MLDSVLTCVQTTNLTLNIGNLMILQLFRGEKYSNQNYRLPPESAYYQSFFLLDNSDRRVKRTRQKSPHFPAGPKQTLHIPGNGSISCLHCEIGIFPFTLHV